MYLHLGQNEIVPLSRIIGVFDLDKCSYEKRTRDYLAAAEREGVVLDVYWTYPAISPAPSWSATILTTIRSCI